MNNKGFGLNRRKNHSLGRNVILGAVSLLLALTACVTTTISWIEDVSQVEFISNDDSQEAPVKIGDKILSSDAVMKNNTNKEVNLGEYFNRSGDMHLSPCYSDGESFYFPIDGGTQSVSGFRLGTKDDANVNYLSATFRLSSEGANTSYWFEKDTKEINGVDTEVPYISFKNGGIEGSPVSGLEQYLRCSLTVDGATTVYALNANGSYIVSDPENPQPGRAMDKYSYCKEAFDDSGSSPTRRSLASNSNYANQGATGSNLNGNTLFAVNQYDSQNKNTVKTITVKIWLEYSDATKATTADVSSVNIKLVSSWAKTRRIFVVDRTVDEYDSGIGHTGSRWLGNSSGKLYWAVNDGDTHFNEMSYIGEYTDTDNSGDTYKIYYIDIPAVYNNVKTTLYRCNGTWNVGNSNDGKVSYWDKWETTFPDTFHSETFSVYSHKFATWDTEKAKKVYFVDSAKFTELGLTPKVYLWDHFSEYGTDVNSKVVKNADWPGMGMTRLYETTGSNNMSIPTYCLFFGSEYDRAVFNDGVSGDRNQLQTQDVYLKDNNQNWFGKYFDMATLGWYNTKNDLPKYTNCAVVNNFNTNGSTQSHIRMVQVDNNNSNWLKCRAFLKTRGDGGTSDYFFKIYDGEKHWGRPSGWSQWEPNYTGADAYLVDIGDNNEEGKLIWIKVSDSDLANNGNENGVITIFYDKNTHFFKWNYGEL